MGLSAIADGLSDLNMDIVLISSFKFSYSDATCCWTYRKKNDEWKKSMNVYTKKNHAIYNLLY